MKKLVLLLLVISLMGEISCSRNSKTSEGPTVWINTDLGKMKVRLYNETPHHRDNFLKLAEKGYFDGIIFHRVINHFMIQGGDPDSRGAHPGQHLGNGGPGYDVPAEFVRGLYHKKGALAAARLGDDENPSKASSGSQFYIVQGRIWRPGELDSLKIKMNDKIRQGIFKTVFTQAQEELDRYKKEKNENAFNTRLAELQIRADSLYSLADKFAFSDEQRKTYTTVGGYPPLDGNYTVFGEVVEGLDVLDKIAAVKTDQFDRPLQDVKMEIKVIH